MPLPPQLFQRESHKAIMRGVMLNSTVYLIKGLGFYPRLVNVRQYLLGEIEPRPGLIPINPTPMPQPLIHSIRQLNSSLLSSSQPYTLIVGAGTHLYTDDPTHSTFVMR